MEEKLFWVTEAVNEASETNSIMNLSHILYVIADTKAPCTILYISGNIPIKTSRTPAQTLPPPIITPFYKGVPTMNYGSKTWRRSQIYMFII